MHTSPSSSRRSLWRESKISRWIHSIIYLVEALATQSITRTYDRFRIVPRSNILPMVMMVSLSMPKIALKKNAYWSKEKKKRTT